MPDSRMTPAPRGIALVLAALAALGPFSIDTYLPSFHDIGASLQASPLQVQQTLTAYLLPFSLMTLWHGAISDALGRRRVILVTVALFALASAGCMLATRIEHLWLLRGLQGMTGGAGIVIGRAIVRDLYDGPQAQRLISQITMMFALAPAVAPVLGGWLQLWFGWRSVFAFLVLMSVALWLACWYLLPETLPQGQRQSLHAGYLARSYWRVLTSPAFLLICGALALNFAAFFIYVLSAPVFLMRHLGVSETGFLWLFGPAMSGLVIGAWLSGRLAGKLSLARTITVAYLIMATAAAVNIGLNVALPPALPWSVIPIFGFTLGMSLAMPCLTLQALDLFPEQRGLAASCQTFLQAGFNSLAAGLIAPALWGSTLSLALGMGGLLLLGAFATLIHQRRSVFSIASSTCRKSP
ncbi:Drug resistance transporter, Bcr/CflA subfamily [Candidatus Accumulibacter aalborgensis]|uniref:Bcr/CflA family efflux transporter n=2 Tax=Candidatus Accumulibacter aalborgensis TaxID=1860102 RepID=A0A1A8XX27_9PROT|nr:multidrug effflux MFS transporter [Candidatus Accumulibacter aalborgensis]SBT09192.1 Drug resistance transporter, Bcr/CflA subfamily [Candidatus Accumulibacter aalborgensis]